jgi:hypothetical protein
LTIFGLIGGQLQGGWWIELENYGDISIFVSGPKEHFMNKSFKITLITLMVILGVPFLVLCGYSFLFADFFSGPSEKQCVKTVEEFLGYKLGRTYEILDYDADYSHPDRQLSFEVKLPPAKFEDVVEFCEKEVDAREEKTTWTEEAGYTYIETFSQDGSGYIKSLQVLYGQDRVHYQALKVNIDSNTISFDGMDH